MLNSCKGLRTLAGKIVPYRQQYVVHVGFRWPSVVGFGQQPATEEQVGYILAVASFKRVRPSQ
jgi:hypothetical protein